MMSISRWGWMLVLLVVPGPTAQGGLIESPEFAQAAIGGGEAYNRILKRDEATHIVSDRVGLLAALASARSDDVIYVEDTARIDLSGVWGTIIPCGITLGSGRGRGGSLGALLYTTTMASKGLLGIQNCLGTPTRVTGLRLEGPSAEIDEPGCDGENPHGLFVEGCKSVEIDNNEIYAWRYAGVRVWESTATEVHHNHIHHCLRKERSEGCRWYSLGYGMVTDKSTEQVYHHNLFDNNRHDVASPGSITQDTDYEVRYSIMLPAISHSLDVHGGDDRATRTDHNAGNKFHFHHNLFQSSSYPAVVVRGIPLTGAWVYENEFPHETSQQAVFQRYATGNLHVTNNLYAVGGYTWLRVLFGGRGYWRLRRVERSLVASGWGDFDGDGTQDAFRADGTNWYVSRSGLHDWERVGSSSRQSGLVLADFNGDGQCDIFYSTGSEWFVSYSGREKWQLLAASKIDPARLHVADFTGDGKADVIYSSGSTWYISEGGTSKWRVLRASIPSGADLVGKLYGDFDGDGAMDVFWADGSTWWISSRGETPWTRIQSSSITEVALGDFDGDGIADVFRASPGLGKWYVSFGGRQRWQGVHDSSLGLDRLILRDVNGDGVTDILAYS